MKIADRLLNFVFPKNLYCICCGDSIDTLQSDSLCAACRRRIDWIEDNPYFWMMEDVAFDNLLACCIWGSEPRRIISSFKAGARDKALPVGRIMAERYLSSGLSADVIVFVPSDEEKLKYGRGFNPGELLARRVGELCFIPVIDVLSKKSTGLSMRKMSRTERKTRMLGVYDLKAPSGKETDFPSEESDELKKIQGAHVLLVDDILTTGSTANEIAALLKDAGASCVTVLVFACGSGSLLYEEGTRL